MTMDTAYPGDESVRATYNISTFLLGKSPVVRQNNSTWPKEKLLSGYKRITYTKYFQSEQRMQLTNAFFLSGRMDTYGVNIMIGFLPGRFIFEQLQMKSSMYNMYMIMCQYMNDSHIKTYL